jgi:hypothetical protein
MNKGRPFCLIEWLLWFGTPQLVLQSTGQNVTEYLHLKGKTVIKISRIISGEDISFLFLPMTLLHKSIG